MGVAENRQANLHTLCLLDIKVKEQSIENLMRGREIYEPPRFMTVRQAIEQLTAIENQQGLRVAAEDTQMVGVARLGRADQAVVFGNRDAVANADIGGPLHSLVICAPELHEMELEFASYFPCTAVSKLPESGNEGGTACGYGT